DTSGTLFSSDRSVIENVASLDLAGVTRRSQALRFAQYQIAASKYLRRVVAFKTSTEALSLAPGDIVSISQNITGINYGFGGKVLANSSTATDQSNVLLEHFTNPSLTNSTFTTNTYPLAMRVISTDDDRVDLYILSNSNFVLTATDNISLGFDQANVTVTGRYNPITKTIDSFTTFTSNNVPKKGDLWSIGEWENPGNVYTNKAGKLFTVSNIERETETEEITLMAKEYISNVYTDSDTFIDYTPTAYIDIESGFSAPPSPVFTLKSNPRRRLDGSVVTDIIINNQTDRLGYQGAFSTEFFVSQPTATTLVNNSHQSVLTLTVDNSSVLVDGTIPCVLTGKNGFQTFAGDIKLLCNGFVSIDNGDGTSNIQLTVEGLNVTHDVNFNKHVLEVNDGAFLNLKGTDHVTVPLKEKVSINSEKNFVGFAPDLVAISANIVAFDKAADTLDIENVLTGSTHMIDLLPPPPFYVNISQLLDARYYANNSFYVTGTQKEIKIQNTFVGTAGSTESIDLPVRVRDQNFVRLYVDGVEKSSGQFTLNKNSTFRDNVQYAIQSGESAYIIEVDHYTVPTIEVGDNVQTQPGVTFPVVNTSYDPASATYNAALTANSIYRIELATAPTNNLTSVTLVNVSPNPVGTMNNVSANTCTLDFDEATYPGNFRLANNGVYELLINSDYERVFLTDDFTIPDVGEGVTSVRARNINSQRRTSPFVEKNVNIARLPIRKVTGLEITESLYREQSSGVAVRATVAFDHIEGQEVTDYEISYKLDNIEAVGSNDGGSDLLSFNTTKISAAGVEDDGKIRFTVSGINRGQQAESNIITFRVTPLNKNIRGTTATVSKSIVGKNAKPANVFNFTGGQQTDQITLFWEYARTNDELTDLDLKEVVIRRLAGTHDATITNFIAAVPFVSVAAGVNRKSIPIDIFNTFTYFARTRDTSGNLSDSVVAITLTTTRPKRSTVVAAYNEDDPSTTFTDINNTNASEFNFPSFANSNTGGIAYAYTSTVDNANGTSTGFSAVAGSSTDLLADEDATYFTQIRDFGSLVTGSINIDISGTQTIETTWNDLHEHIVESVTEVGEPTNNVLHDSSFGGIGHIVGFGNTQSLAFRYDANNETMMSGGSFGNVYAIHLHGNFTNDESNANVFAYIAGAINANAIALGETFFANGESTGSNALANISVAGTSYYLVDMNQWGDPGGTSTFVGALGSLTTQTFVRTSSEDAATLFYANGNVNVAAFTGSSVNEGFIPYEAGSRTFRHFQIKFVVNNSKPDEFDFTIDKFRYTIEKDQTIFEETVTYDGNPKTVDYSSSNFINRPVITIQAIDTATAQTAVVTTGSSTSVSFRLYDVENNALAPTNQSIQVQVTAIGV
ncbi:MAG: phage tail protein, partial [Pelagibacteraceae bacterium]